MSYVAIYRKFRPQTFSRVKGQETIVQTLQNQIKNDRIGHAYLFTGTRGTGKTSVARIFAKAINCQNPKDGEPCNECPNCLGISEGNFIDVIEIDAASNTGVDDIRRVIEEVQYSPVSGRYKVYIIDEAHMLSGAAANAFLKTLEEPPEYAVFILATTEPHKLPVTILSRCQRYDFKRVDTEKISENIFEYLKQENIDADEKAIHYIATCGDGSMRDALSLLDKAIAFNPGEKLTYENVLSALGTVDTGTFSKLFRCIADADAYGAVTGFDGEVKNGKDISRFVSDFIWYLRNLLLINAGGKDNDVLGISEENMAVLAEDAKVVPKETLMRYIRILSELVNSLRFSNEKQVLTDVALIKLAKPQMETDIESVTDRIRQLENKISALSGIKVSANAGTQNKPEAASVNVNESKPETKETPGNTNAILADENSESIEENPADKNIVNEMPGISEVEVAETNEQPADAGRTPVANTSGSDAERVCAAWNEILAGCSAPLLKVHLGQTNIKPYDAETVEIICGSDMVIARLESKKDEIKNMIKEATGIDINVIINQGTVIANDATSFETPEYDDEDLDIDSLLKQNIRMEIETEDI